MVSASNGLYWSKGKPNPMPWTDSYVLIGRRPGCFEHIVSQPFGNDRARLVDDMIFRRIDFYGVPQSVFYVAADSAPIDVSEDVARDIIKRLKDHEWLTEGQDHLIDLARHLWEGADDFVADLQGETLEAAE